MKSLNLGLNLLILSQLVKAEIGEIEVLLGQDLTAINPSIPHADGSGSDECQFYANPEDLVWMCIDEGVSEFTVLPNEHPFNQPAEFVNVYSDWQARLGGRNNGLLEKGFSKADW